MNSSDRLAHQDWRRFRLQLDKKFRQRFPVQIHDRVSDKVWSTSKVLGNLQRSREKLRDEKCERVHVALLALTESESYDIVPAPSGLEALRRLARRLDPVSGGKRRALLRQILVPYRCKLQDLPARLEKWEALVRRYERSKSSGTATAAHDEDIKTAALEALVPNELDQHLAMNRARLIAYEKVRSEIQSLIAARRSQFEFKTVAAKGASDPMDVDSYGKGGKKGKKGKGDGINGPNPSKDVVCWHCGKKGHLSTECRSNPENQSLEQGKASCRSGTAAAAGSCGLSGLGID